MELWSWHKPEHFLTSGRVDLSRSEFYNTVENCKAAYDELANCLGTDQLIWCYTRRNGDFSSGWEPRVCWHLDVPDYGILRLTDDRVWNKILGRDMRRPDSLHRQWLRTIPVGEGYAYLRRKEEEYHAQPAPNGDWWSVLFLERDDFRLEDGEQLASALILHPIPETWVVSVGEITSGNDTNSR